MSEAYTNSGRMEQKLQTRKKILETARQLLQKGGDCTLEDVAREAEISRATIYRYYSNMDLLSAEAVLDMQASTPEAVFESLKSTDLTDKMIEIQDYYNRLVLNNETAFRKYLGIVINDKTAASGRSARRVETMKLALQKEGKQFSKKDLQTLIHVAAVLTGVEAVVVAKDVCGLNAQQLKKTLNWGLSMMIKGMMHEEEKRSSV